MKKFWNYIAIEENYKRLGLVFTFISGLFYLGLEIFKHYNTASKTSATQTTYNNSATANNGSIAVSGNGNSVINGITDESYKKIIEPHVKMSEYDRKEIEKLKKDLNLKDEQISGALKIVSDENVPPEKIIEKLSEVLRQHKKLRDEADIQLGDNPKIAALKAKAKIAIEAFKLDDASKILSEVDEEYKLLSEAVLSNRAQNIVRQGEIALIQLRYLVAANHFAEAAKIVSLTNVYNNKKIEYLQLEASALYKQGDEFGDTSALKNAIERRIHLIKLLSTGLEHKKDLARTQNDLGNALSILGKREVSIPYLQQAVNAYNHSLEERTQIHVPMEWAMTKNNLCVALRTLGEFENSIDNIELAATACSDALQERRREIVPLDWARTQNNLGNAVFKLGVYENNLHMLNWAVEAYQDALKELKFENVPLDYAMTKNNLGNAFLIIGTNHGSINHIKEAVEAYRQSLKVNTRKRVPLEWAGTQFNLGHALKAMGEREVGIGYLEEATVAYINAQEEFTPETHPSKWTIIQDSLRTCIATINERKKVLD